MEQVENTSLPPSLAALLARDDFASTIFESGRCAHSVFESGRCAHSVGAASEWWTASSLALDSLLAALDGDATVSPRGGASGAGAKGPCATGATTRDPSYAAALAVGSPKEAGVSAPGGWRRCRSSSA